MMEHPNGHLNVVVGVVSILESRIIHGVRPKTINNELVGIPRESGVGMTLSCPVSWLFIVQYEYDLCSPVLKENPSNN